MKNRNPLLKLTAFLLLLISLALACNLSPASQLSGKTGGLQIDPRAADGSVSGSYLYSADTGKNSVQFSVSADGQAFFRLENAPDEEMLIVNATYEQPPHLIWQGQYLDGIGALSSEEQAALNDLFNSDLVNGLAMIPLDMACQNEDVITPEQVAALLFPLQMGFKYQITNRSAFAGQLAALAACDYNRDEEGEPGKLPPLILMTPGSPVPVVFGYFPFDEIGAADPPNTGAGIRMASLNKGIWPNFAEKQIGLPLPAPIAFGTYPIQNEWGPCQAKCRGACGPDCTRNNCTFFIDDRCEKNQDGENDGSASLVQVYDCGVHPACIKHDACYDDCNRRHGCDTWAAAICMHAGVIDFTVAWATILGANISCDKTTLNEEDISNVLSWVRGYGPFTARQTYEYHLPEFRYVEDPINCPRPDKTGPETSPETVPLNETTINGDEYKGTANFYYMENHPRVKSITSDVNIIVAENEQLVGSIAVYILEHPYEGEGDCQGYWENWIDISFNDQLTNGYGIVEGTMHYRSKNHYSNCTDSRSPGTSLTVTHYVEVQIIGDTITGIAQQSPNDEEGKFLYGFTATKQ